jgi:hypothetical protein
MLLLILLVCISPALAFLVLCCCDAATCICSHVPALHVDSARVYEGQYGFASVAIKINKVPFGVDEDSTDEFLKEMAILLAGQNHPNGWTSPFVHIPHFASRVCVESGSFYVALRPCFGNPLSVECLRGFFFS